MLFGRDLERLGRWKGEETRRFFSFLRLSAVSREARPRVSGVARPDSSGSSEASLDEGSDCEAYVTINTCTKRFMGGDDGKYELHYRKVILALLVHSMGNRS